MTLNRNLILLVIAILCFLVALLLDVDVFSGSHEPAWIAGGLAAFAAAHL